MTKDKLDRAYALQESDWKIVYEPIMLATGKSFEEIEKAEKDYFAILDKWYNKELKNIESKDKICKY